MTNNARKNFNYFFNKIKEILLFLLELSFLHHSLKMYDNLRKFIYQLKTKNTYLKKTI